MVQKIGGDTKQPYLQVPLNDANIKHYLKPKNEQSEEIHEFDKIKMIDEVKENIIKRKKSPENKKDNTSDRIAKIIEKAKNINGAKRVKTPDKKENFMAKNKQIVKDNPKIDIKKDVSPTRPLIQKRAKTPNDKRVVFVDKDIDNLEAKQIKKDINENVINKTQNIQIKNNIVKRIKSEDAISRD